MYCIVINQIRSYLNLHVIIIINILAVQALNEKLLLSVGWNDPFWASAHFLYSTLPMEDL